MWGLLGVFCDVLGLCLIVLALVLLLWLGVCCST